MRTAVLAGCVAMAGIGLWSSFAPSAPGIDPVVSGSVAGISRTGMREYAISNVVAKTTCVAKRGAALTARSRAFFADAACDDVWPGLSSAQNWTETGDGSVILSDASGEAVLTVAASDGPDLEAIDPPDAILTVAAVR